MAPLINLATKEEKNYIWQVCFVTFESIKWKIASI